MSCTVLVQSMEMERCRPIAKLIIDIDNHLVADIGLNAWNWPFAIDSHDTTLKLAIGISGDPTDIEVIDSCLG